MSIAKRVGKGLAPKVTQVAPHITAGFVQQALDRANPRPQEGGTE